MRIPRWRFVLTGALVVVLGTAVVGVAVAGSSDDPRPDIAESGSAPAGGAAAVDAVTSTNDALDAALFFRGRPLARLAAARHLVHLELRFVDRAGEIVEHHLDHGTIQSLGAGALVISEADGTTITVVTNDETVVRLGRQAGQLSDLTAGDDVVVHSRVDDGTVVARHVVRLPPSRAASSNGG